MTLSIKTTIITSTIALLASVPLLSLAQFDGPPPPPLHHHDGAGVHTNDGPPPPHAVAGSDDSELDVVRQTLIERIIALIQEKFGVTLALNFGSDRPAGPSGSDQQSGGQGPGGGSGAPGGSHDFVGGDAGTLDGFTLPDSDYLSDYTIEDDDRGTEVTVTVSGDTRTIIANALPNHETGDFPNSGNPNAISAQSNTYRFPSEGEYTGNAVWAREPGVAINGVKFEPETAEVVTCSNGESYKIEALQDVYDLGFDMNNAHVQPGGTYHYHGLPELLLDIFTADDDLVHVGFAADGHLIYYDTTGSIEASYALSESERTGSSCTYRNDTIVIEGTDPDGTYVSDWEYVAGSGDLDACNGAFVEGEYAYFITDEYPFVSRCLQGEM